MTSDLQTVIGDTPINGQSFAERAGNLAPAARVLYRRLITSLVEDTSPTLDRLADAAAPLINADLIQTDDNGLLAVAYPFSVKATRHCVTLRDGRRYHAMCAIDALGIRYMLDQPGEIQSQESDAIEVVRSLSIPEQGPTWTPAGAEAVAALGEDCCSAQSACPNINLFASHDAAGRYLDGHALHGGVLPITAAVTAGRWLFGDLLRTLTSTS